MEKLRALFTHNDRETLDQIVKRERELDEERQLTRLSKREAMDSLFSAMLDPDNARDARR